MGTLSGSERDSGLGLLWKEETEFPAVFILGRLEGAGRRCWGLGEGGEETRF
jgi:hypothetical protein